MPEVFPCHNVSIVIISSMRNSLCRITGALLYHTSLADVSFTISHDKLAQSLGMDD